jgi:hypothetical protein
MKRLLLLGISLFSYLLATYAQDNEPYMQLSGMVKNDLNDPIPFVHIISKKTQRNTVSDQNGLYTVIVQPMDTVYFSCIGYKRKKVAMPQTLASKHLIRDIHMDVDTIMLNQIVIFPWKNYAEFKAAVLNVELPHQEEMEAAEINIAIMQAQILLHDSNTPNGNFRQVMMQQFERNRTIGQIPYNGLLDPLAWVKFIKALKNGDFKRKK